MVWQNGAGQSQGVRCQCGALAVYTGQSTNYVGPWNQAVNQAISKRQAAMARQPYTGPKQGVTSVAQPENDLLKQIAELERKLADAIVESIKSLEQSVEIGIKPASVDLGEGRN